MPRSTHPVVNGLIVELAKEEKALLLADNEARRVNAKLDVATRKYVAVRDALATFLGSSPYDPDLDWPTETEAGLPPTLRGRFRFAGMNTGDAIIAVLKETGGQMGLNEIAQRLAQGGLSIAVRSVNAALINLENVAKDEEGRTYQFVAPELDPDDLPFE